MPLFPLALAQADASALLSLGVTLLPYLFAGLMGVTIWALAAWRSKQDAQAGQSKVAAVLSRVLTLAEAVVQDLEATLKPEMKAAAADGRLTREELAKLKSLALDRLKESLGQHGLEELRQVLALAAPSLGTILSGLVETALDRVKAGKAVAKAQVPAPVAVHLGPGARLESLGALTVAEVPPAAAGAVK